MRYLRKLASESNRYSVSICDSQPVNTREIGPEPLGLLPL